MNPGFPTLHIQVDRFTVRGYHGADVVCDLVIGENFKHKKIAIFSEIILPDGNYMDCISVTNGIEYLATAVLRQWPYHEIAYYVEHYPERGPKNDRRPEDFSLVLFGKATPDVHGAVPLLFHNPSWTYASREVIQRLVTKGLD